MIRMQCTLTQASYNPLVQRKEILMTSVRLTFQRWMSKEMWSSECNQFFGHRRVLPMRFVCIFIALSIALVNSIIMC